MAQYLLNHYITDHLVFVIVSAERVMVCLPNGTPVSCEIRLVIHFYFHAKIMSSAEIRQELCDLEIKYRE
jgi:hypothetical protein